MMGMHAIIFLKLFYGIFLMVTLCYMMLLIFRELVSNCIHVMSLRRGEKYQGEYIIKHNIVIQIIKNNITINISEIVSNYMHVI